MRGQVLTLASNAGAGNGTGLYWQGGKGTFTAEATFGGGSVKMQYKTINGTFVDVDGATLSAAGTKFFELAAGEVRVVITTASAVYAYAHPV